MRKIQENILMYFLNKSELKPKTSLRGSYSRTDSLTVSEAMQDRW